MPDRFTLYRRDRRPHLRGELVRGGQYTGFADPATLTWNWIATSIVVEAPDALDAAIAGVYAIADRFGSCRADDWACRREGSDLPPGSVNVILSDYVIGLAKALELRWTALQRARQEIVDGLPDPH